MAMRTKLSSWFPNKDSRLCSAVSKGDHVGVEKALKNGANPDTCMPWEFPEDLRRKFKNVPVLTLAIHKGYRSIITSLITAKVNVDLLGDYDAMALHVAAALGQSDIVEQLLLHGADVSSRTNNGRLPIHWAAYSGSVVVANILHSYGCNFDVTDNEGTTPLHWAATNGRKPMVKWLLKQGVNPSLLDKNGDTAADLAERAGHTELESLLSIYEVDMAMLSIQESSEGGEITNSVVATTEPSSKESSAITENLSQKSKSQDCAITGTTEATFSLPSPIVDNMLSAMTHFSTEESFQDEVDYGAPATTIAGSYSATDTASQLQEYLKKIFILNYIDFLPQIFTKEGENTTTRVVSRREGASKDSENLCSTFKKLGYEVHLHENRTAEQTNNILDSIQQHEILDFLLLVILSHGLDEDTFLTSDGHQLSLKNIQQRFTDTGCPKLRGKNKTILVNFCRGSNREKISPIEETDQETDQENNFSDSDSVGTLLEPPHNMITLFSSHVGFESMRSRKKGTSFVQHLCKVLNEQPTLPIQEVFNLIYNRMEPGKGQTPEMRISPPFDNFIF